MKQPFIDAAAALQAQNQTRARQAAEQWNARVVIPQASFPGIWVPSGIFIWPLIQGFGFGVKGLGFRAFGFRAV